MRKNLLLPVALLLLLFSACKKDDVVKSSANVNNVNALAKGGNDQSQSGHIKIAVVSDIHYMDPSQLTNNAQASPAFFNAIISNKAMQEYSAPIFRSVVADLLQEHPDIVLIAGDLTKSGEYMNHQTIVQQLNSLKDVGIKVYVVPGNNDINNPKAVSYNGNSVTNIRNTTPAEFADFYSDFGYNASTVRDNFSLSYVAKPYPDLWILAIDPEQYNPFGSTGIIKDATMEWIKKELDTAQRAGITVLGLMHHNLIPHFEGHSAPGSFSANSVIENWQTRIEDLMSKGLQVIFTGHSHATDVTDYSFKGKTLYDIATGSLVTPPSLYRIMYLKNKELEYTTNYVTSIDQPLLNNMDFREYSDQALTSLLDKTFHIYLVPLFKIQPTLVDSVIPLVIAAFKAQTEGDEKISPAEQLRINALDTVQPRPTLLINTLNALWTDPGVKDIKWHIKLEGR